MRGLGALVFVACLPSLTGSCGGSNHANPDASVGGMIGSVSPLVDAFCAAARACCAKDGRPLVLLANCEQHAGATFGAAQASGGTIRVDGAVFDACVAAYQRAATSCTFMEVWTACRGLFIGTLSTGATCTRVADCRRDQGPMVCVLIRTTSGVSPTTGTCQPAPRGAENDACLASCPMGRDCSIALLSGLPNPPLALCYEQDGLFCDSDWTCKPMKPLGADCSYDEDCGTGKYCLPGCERTLTVGAACEYNRSCGSGYCAAGACAPAPLATDEACQGYPRQPIF